MFKTSCAGKDHDQIMFIDGIDGFLVENKKTKENKEPFF